MHLLAVFRQLQYRLTVRSAELKNDPVKPLDRFQECPVVGEGASQFWVQGGFDETRAEIGHQRRVVVQENGFLD